MSDPNDVGDTTTLTLTVAPASTDTVAVVAVTLPNGSLLSPALTATPNAGKTVWTALLPLTAGPGDYTAEWTVAGTGAGVEYDTVTAAVPPPATTAVRQVRLLISDIDPARRVFTIGQVLEFLDLEGQDVRLAAATALEVVARSEALVSKVIRTQDLQTDGAKLAAELRASAQELRSQAAAAAGDADESGGLEIVNFDPWAPTAAELAEWTA